jgi:hypothetical protein
MKRLAMVLMVVLGLFCVGALAVFAQSADTAPTRVGAQTATAQESVPRLVQFTGTLKDAAARPLAGVASVTFAIYAEQDGGTPLWNETQNVLADGSGHFNVLLGSATAAGVPTELFGTGQSRWLGVTIARQPEMARVLLASVPYALKAGDAETLGGLPASAYVTTQSLAAKTSTKTLAPGSTTILATPETPAQSMSAASPAAIPQATPTGSGTTDFIPLWTSATALGNSLLFQTGGNVGINTKTPTETLDVNGNSIFRGSFQLPPGHDATTSSGFESHSFQFQASSYNSSTKASTVQAFGFRAEPLNNNTASPSAKLDLFFIPNGGSQFIDTGFSFSSTGIVTFASAQTFPSLTLTGPIFAPNSAAGSAILSVGGQPFIANYGSNSNAFLGPFAGGGSETSAQDDTAVGLNSSESLTIGVSNTSVGAFSLVSNQTASRNSAFGFDALSNTTGSNNTGLGAFAGQSNVAGTNNIFIGDETDALSPNLTNAIAIGTAAAVGASNSMVLGGTGSFTVNVGVGTSAPQSMLDLESNVSSQTLGTPPSPAITLTNLEGGADSKVSIDFNTSAPTFGASYNPSARILAFDTGGFTDEIVFQANQNAKVNGGLTDTMVISANGNVEVIGNLKVDGMLMKSSGSFKIDDPIDPGGKYLSHSFVESPDMMNIYNGNVLTNAKGYAVVTMPAWFEALNSDFRYQLTPVGQFSQAMISSEIKDRKFTIRTSKPHVKVSWMVTGIRQDAWAQAHRIPTEELKPANEQGHYMHPELFGAGPDQAVGAAPAREATDAKKNVKKDAKMDAKYENAGAQ